MSKNRERGVLTFVVYIGTKAFVTLFSYKSWSRASSLEILEIPQKTTIINYIKFTFAFSTGLLLKISYFILVKYGNYFHI